MTTIRSRAYWRKREEANLKSELLKEKAYTKALSDIYSDMMDSIQKEIDAFYTKYAGEEGITYSEAVKRASKLDIEAYGRKARKYIKEHDLSPTANAEMRLYNLTMKANRLEVLKAEIGAELARCFNDIEGECRYALNERTQEELERQAGILGDTVHDNEKAANAIVNASFKNATFSDRIWMHQDILKGELNNLLSQGLIQGKHPSVLARDLRKRVDVSKHDAERLLRTELCRVQIEAQKQSYERNGYDEYEFIALEGHACSICSALDGQHFKVSDMVSAENAPPMHPNCRCSTVPHMDMEAYDKWIDSGAAKNDVSFKDFKYLHTAGSSSVTFESGYDTHSKKNEAEIAQAHWMVDTFGGKILLLTRSLSEPTPDYKWNGKYWDLKTPQSVNGSDKLVHHGLHQINKCPGGILVDCSNAIDTQRVIEIVKARLRRSGKNKDIRIIVKDGKEVVAILK